MQSRVSSPARDRAPARQRRSVGLEALEPRTLLAALPAPPPEAQVNTFTRDHQRYPSVASDADGDYVVAWQSYQQEELDWDVYAQRHAADGTKRGSEFRVNQDTSTSATDASVASDAAGNFIVVWTQGPSAQIYARRFWANGSPMTDEFLIDPATEAGTASVAMDADGDFVIAWDAPSATDGRRNVYAERFLIDSGRQPAFRVNTNLTGSAWEPDVSMDLDGDFAVAFEVGDDPLLAGSYVRRFDNNGVASLPEARLSVSRDAAAPAVSMADDGSFVVSWGAPGAVYARIFEPSGLPLVDDILTGALVIGAASNPQAVDVSADARRDFVVTWSSSGTDGQSDVYARGFAPDGSPVASPFRINNYVVSQQGNPSVAMSDDGGFVAAWNSWGQDGSLYGVYARHFASTAPPATTVTARRVYYNRSVFDGDATEPGPADDVAVPTNKVALLTGGTPSFLNVTSYTRGLNGVMIDLADLPGGVPLEAGDFAFRSGTTADPSTWSAGPEPAAITTRAIAPGRYRVTLMWRDYDPKDTSGLPQAVANGWLEVRLNANGRTNLAADDVFYFGNLIGETGGTNASGMLGVTATDLGRVRAAQVRSGASTASVNNVYDFNRDGRVNVLDAGVVRSREGLAVPLPTVRLLSTASATMQAAPQVTAAGATVRGRYLASVLA
jgi:hypothetical protein